ncbi:hypothetical protein BIV57_16985 [Mangrovactinospora gilvigrisea]|uniref:Short-chain dehydrogenase n=1 Tax=Mangrovactinospora gilvigrisea TaxID=1428644 RepID=A0A1J7C462_9ACTN|nr:hypothetical protein BIV57_16985 [Mangrovactinospora gilvigrisea]
MHCGTRAEAAAEFDALLNVSLKAPFFLVRHALLDGRLLDGGRIVNISSGVVRTALPEIVASSATKGGLDVFTRHLAKQLGPRGITVDTVAPGFVATDNTSWLRDDQAKAARAAGAGVGGRA